MRLTGLTGDLRDSFMIHYRPGYEFTKKATDYEFYIFIRNNFKRFIQESPFDPRPVYNSDFKNF
jgi:hypothetical protein